MTDVGFGLQGKSRRCASIGPEGDLCERSEGHKGDHMTHEVSWTEEAAAPVVIPPIGDVRSNPEEARVALENLGIAFEVIRDWWIENFPVLIAEVTASLQELNTKLETLDAKINEEKP